MNKATSIAAFIFGAAVGSGVTWYFLKDKYEKIAQREIDSVKKVFSKRRESDIPMKEEKIEHVENPKDNDTDLYKQYLKKISDYTAYSVKTPTEEAKQEQKEADEPVYKEKPYVISPEEFGMEDDYDEISLTYFSDQILADENDEIVEDVEKCVGFDSLNHFGEYEDDSVFVRNDRLKCDYEILLDRRKYTDVVGTTHYREGIL